MKMKKLFVVFFILLLTTASTFAYSIKVYDQWGNRVGTYKKEGDNFVLYDFHDRKVENPESLIKNPPDNKTLKEYTQYFYDENMNPIGSYSAGFWWNNGRYYPRGRFIPRGFYPPRGRSIVCPNANKGSVLYEDKYPYGMTKQRF